MKSDFKALKQQLILAARRGESAQASSLIPGYLEALQRAMQDMSAAQVKGVEDLLPQLLASQSEEDWVRFADLLEDSAG